MTRQKLSPEFAREIGERDQWMCVCCGIPIRGERGVDWSIHHRIPRGMGGSKDPRINMASNLLTVCGTGTQGCHGEIESHRDRARERGLLVWRSLDPSEVPVLVCVRPAAGLSKAQLRPFILDPFGGRVEVRDGAHRPAVA
jgi:hypothetical protein